MNKQIDIELVQDKYTNFIVYDGSDRTNIHKDWIDIHKLRKIEVMFRKTSEHLIDDMNYIIDITKAAIHQGNKEFTFYDFSKYDCAEELKLIVNDTELSFWVTTNVLSIEQLVDILNSQTMTRIGILFFAVGNYVEVRTTNVGSSQYIKILNSKLATRLGFRQGIYRGNDISWGHINLQQKDINYYIRIEDLNFTDYIPDGQWDIDVHIEYEDTTPSLPISQPPITLSYQTFYTEFTYKLIEIYRAKLFEYIAKNFKSFEHVEQRVWTKEERTMYSILQFDAAYKSFISALEVGNLNSANAILSYLINYKQLNPVL